jgi:hypothetical protein
MKGVLEKQKLFLYRRYISARASSSRKNPVPSLRTDVLFWNMI